MTLSLSNNVFLQDLALETPERALQGFSIDNMNFGQTKLLAHGGGLNSRIPAFWSRKRAPVKIGQAGEYRFDSIWKPSGPVLDLASAV